MKKVFIIFVLMYFNIFISYCIEIPNLVPTSPNAAELGKYGSIPVSYYTGIPQISIPLYEIELDGKKFPINISYHASGVKVATESSNVGLGWSLSAGGAIIRQINQSDDFKSFPIGYYYDEDLPKPLVGNNYDPVNYKYEDYENYYLNQRDGEPDYYYYNFANYSGMIFFQKINNGNNNAHFANGEIQKKECFMESQFDIDRNRWIISDGDGYKYYFGTLETTYNYSQGGFQVNIHPEDIDLGQLLNSPASPYQDVTTAWLLDSIISPNNHKIKFEYTSDEIYTPVKLNEIVNHLLSTQNYPCRDPNTNYNLSGILGKVENYSYSMSKIVQRNISKIKTDNIEIAFSTTDREDIQSVSSTTKPQKISEMIVRNSKSEIVKYYKFNYSYLGTTTGSKYINQKLCLDNISEGIRNPIKHIFNYNKNIIIPPKNSNQIDDFGYYNGAEASSNVWDKESNTTSINRLITYIPESQNGPDLYKGRKRIISEANMKAGILTSIIYPTGGEVNFIYEPNLVNSDSGGDIETEETVRTLLGEVNMRNYIPNPDDDPNPLAPKYLSEFNLSVTSNVIFTYFFNVVEWLDGVDDTQANDCIVLRNKVTHQIVKTISFGAGNLYGYHEYSIPQLLKGDYELVLYSDRIYSPHKFGLSSRIYYDKPISVTNSGVKAGGLRIKEITTSDNGVNLTKNTYTYSTGTLMRKPCYTGLNAYLMESTNGNCKSTYITLFGRSNSLVPFSNSANGSTVGYDWVKEDKGTMGKIIYYYHNQKDNAPEDFEYCIIDFPSTPYLNNGLIEKKEYYSSSNKHVKDLVYKYDVNSGSSNIIKGLKFGTKAQSMGDDGFGDLYKMADVFIKYYDVKSEQWQLINESEIDYDNNEEIIRQTDIKYKYNDKINKPSSITTTYQDKKTSQIIHKYPEDANVDPSTVYLKNKNIINTPVETINLLDNKIVEAVKKTFDVNALLKKTYTLKTNNSLVLTDNYSLMYSLDYEVLRYNSYGNIVTLVGHDGIATTYLWGYKNQYPIAKITNATYDEVSDALVGITPEQLANSVLPDIEKIDALRQNPKMIKSFITTYTYKPAVGILTVKDPRGVLTNYEYDTTFNRLINIKDNSGNTVKTIDYHYKNIY